MCKNTISHIFIHPLSPSDNLSEIWGKIEFWIAGIWIIIGADSANCSAKAEPHARAKWSA